MADRCTGVSGDRNITAVLYLAKKERKRKKAFDEFLAMPDSYHEEQLLHDAENLQAEIRSFSQILHEQMDQCAQTKLQLNDYEEYVEAWAHEVKTPLALLTFMLDNHRDELSEDVVCKLDRINCQMQRYIDQMLYYARLKGARKDYRFESVDTETCVKEVLEDFTPLLEEQKIQVQLDIKEKVKSSGSPVSESKRRSFCLSGIMAWVSKPAIFRMYLRKALPEIPGTGGRKQPGWDFILQKKWHMT